MKHIATHLNKNNICAKGNNCNTNEELLLNNVNETRPRSVYSTETNVNERTLNHEQNKLITERAFNFKSLLLKFKTLDKNDRKEIKKYSSRIVPKRLLVSRQSVSKAPPIISLSDQPDLINRIFLQMMMNFSKEERNKVVTILKEMNEKKKKEK